MWTAWSPSSPSPSRALPAGREPQPHPPAATAVARAGARAGAAGRGGARGGAAEGEGEGRGRDRLTRGGPRAEPSLALRGGGDEVPLDCRESSSHAPGWFCLWAGRCRAGRARGKMRCGGA